jgi:3'-phosphoadenosine 5'-phosphosulfate sulfotransferase (PAPS reductase)/FAD synthetase
LFSRIGSRRVVLSVSGGKDSAAASLYLRELGIDHDRVFADTGWEHPATYDYLRGPLTEALGPIHEVKSEKYPGGMPDLCRRKGSFPSRLRRFCTEQLKVKPIFAFLNASEDAEPLNAVGIRAAESRARACLPEWDESRSLKCEVWRPILRWTEQQVIDIHARHGLVPNPLYLLGASRVGCWPCIFARKSELRLLGEIDPGRVDTLRDLETEVAAACVARYSARGDVRKHGPPYFFQANGAQRSDAVSSGACVPIDQVMRWARTSHGGRQYELFHDPSDGCVRWGMCE